jgi:hypothetical protein
MQEDRALIVARMSAETSASASLDDVWRWLIRCQSSAVRLEVDDLPALGQGTRLRLALPLSAPRAVLCTLWLLEDVDAGACLLAGQLRFVAHPTASEIRLSFNGRSAMPMRSDRVGPHSDQVARQLVSVIAESIERPSALARAAV